jgi:hypothetical protein
MRHSIVKLGWPLIAALASGLRPIHATRPVDR